MFYCLIWEWEFKNGSMSFEVLFFFHVWLLGKYGKMNEVEFQFWVFNLKMIPKKAKEKKILGFLVLTIFFFFNLLKVYDGVAIQVAIYVA